LLLTLEVPARGCIRGHDRTVLAGELMKFLTAAPIRGLDAVTGLVEVLPVVAEKDALATRCTEWSGISEMRLTAMRAADLLLKRRVRTMRSGVPFRAL